MDPVRIARRCKLWAATLTALLSVSAAAGPAEEKPSESPRILLLGDSHTCGPMGRALDALLREKISRTVTAYALTSSSVGWWLGPEREDLRFSYIYHLPGQAPRTGTYYPKDEPPKFEAMLAAAPDVVIVALGSNRDHPSPGDPHVSVDATVHKALELIARLPPSTRCYWIGPPPMKGCWDTTTFYAKFRPALDRAGPAHSCMLIDSYAYLTSIGAKEDSCHYGGPAASKWGEAWGRFAFKSVCSDLKPSGCD
jgi:hypothetical protein